MVINGSLASNPQTGLAPLDKPLAQTTSAEVTNAPAAADLASSFNSQFNGINAALGSVANAASITQSQDGLLQNIGNALEQMGQLAASAQSPNATDADQASANEQFLSLSAYITQTAGLDFNGVSLFSGSGVSASSDANGGTFTLPGINLNLPAYTNATASDLSTPQGQASALASVQAALSQLATDRATASSNLSQLDTTSDRLAVGSENVNAATDITTPDAAQQSTSDAASGILNQSDLAMLAQAHQLPQSVLSLLHQ